jgi:DNA-directed RNA polymerase subunit F
LRSILSGYKRLVSFILFSEDKLRAIVDLVEKYLREDMQE